MSDVIGTISAVCFDPGQTGLEGWLFCDGSAVSRATYDLLFKAIGTDWGKGDGTTTFNLPDLRGYFVRGVDDGAKRDPDSAGRSPILPGGNPGDKTGSVQPYATGLPATKKLTTDSDGAHVHTIPNLPTSNSYYPIAGSHYAAWNADNTATSANGAHTHICGRGNSPGGDQESRPVNVYVNFMIYTGLSAREEAARKSRVGTVELGDYPIGACLSLAGEMDEATLKTQGWLYCGGQAVPRKDFQSLFNTIGTAFGQGDGLTTFNLPDFRGFFLRGVSGNSGHDPDAAHRQALLPGGNPGNAVGSVQGYATGKPAVDMQTNTTGQHQHTVLNIPNSNSSGRVAGSYQCEWNSGSGSTDSQGAHTHDFTSGGDAETRPVNACTYFIIKFQ